MGGHASRGRRWFFRIFILLVCLPARAATTTDDPFILGYATATLEQQFKIKAGSLQVTNGTITVRAEDLGAADREKVVHVLRDIRGVVNVTVIEASNGKPSVRPTPEAASAVELGETRPRRGGEFLPEGRLFEPLIADPHWPHFSMAYQSYRGDEELENVAAVSIGTIIGVYENDFFAGGRAGRRVGDF